MDDLLDTGNKNSTNVAPGALPNATAVLVLGIISIIGCVFYGVPGLICGIIALVLHKKDKRFYQADPMKYDASFKNSRAGFICAVVGVSLSALFFLSMLTAILVGVSGALR